MSLLFLELVNRKFSTYQESELLQLSGKELSAIAQLMGLRVSGTKANKIEKIMGRVQIAPLIRPYWPAAELDDTPKPELIQALADRYSRVELIGLCKRVGLTSSFNKYGIASRLIAWDRQCHKDGVSNFKQAREQIQNNRTAFQKTLNLFS